MAVGMAASFHVGHRAQIERPNFEPHQFQQNFQERDQRHFLNLTII